MMMRLIEIDSWLYRPKCAAENYESRFLDISCFDSDFIRFSYYGQLLEHQFVLLYCPALLFVHCYCCLFYTLG